MALSALFPVGPKDDCHEDISDHHEEINDHHEDALDDYWDGAGHQQLVMLIQM